MLVTIDGDGIEGVPHEWEFWQRNKQLTTLEQAAIEEVINQRVDASLQPDGSLICCSSFVAGSDWTNTPLQVLYEKAGQDEDIARLWYGQWFWFALMRRPETFMFERFEHLGPDRIVGLTYWRVDMTRV